MTSLKRKISPRDSKNEKRMKSVISVPVFSSMTMIHDWYKAKINSCICFSREIRFFVISTFYMLCQKKMLSFNEYRPNEEMTKKLNVQFVKAAVAHAY